MPFNGTAELELELEPADGLLERVYSCTFEAAHGGELAFGGHEANHRVLGQGEPGQPHRHPPQQKSSRMEGGRKGRQ